MSNLNKSHPLPMIPLQLEFGMEGMRYAMEWMLPMGNVYGHGLYLIWIVFLPQSTFYF